MTAEALRALAAKLSPANRPPSRHPLDALRAAGYVHPSAHYTGSEVLLIPGARVFLGADSILLGRLVFHRPGSFYLGARSYVGPQTEIHVSTGVTIADDVMIAWGGTLIDTNNHSLWAAERADDVRIAGGRDGLTAADKDWTRIHCAPLHVGPRAWLGLRAIVLPGVTLGAGAIVGAGSVVTRDVPAWTVVAGNPARPIRTLSGPDRPGTGAAPANRRTEAQRCPP